MSTETKHELTNRYARFSAPTRDEWEAIVADANKMLKERGGYKNVPRVDEPYDDAAARTNNAEVANFLLERMDNYVRNPQSRSQDHYAVFVCAPGHAPTLPDSVYDAKARLAGSKRVGTLPNGRDETFDTNDGLETTIERFPLPRVSDDGTTIDAFYTNVFLLVLSAWT